MTDNALTTTGGKPSLLAMHTALQQYAQAQKINLTRFLSFHNVRGEFLTKDAEKVEVVVKFGTQFYVNVPKIAHGFVCWKDSQAKEKIMYLMQDMPTLPDTSTLPDHGPYEGDRDGWSEQMSIPFYHPIEKMGYVFQVSSMSSLNATKKMLGKIIAAAVREGKDVDNDVPLIEVYRDSYKNRMTKKDMFIPGFKVVGWVKASDLNLEVSGLPPKDDDAEPAKAIAGVNADI